MINLIEGQNNFIHVRVVAPYRPCVDLNTRNLYYSQSKSSVHDKLQIN